jgi:hypothetical protein
MRLAAQTLSAGGAERVARLSAPGLRPPKGFIHHGIDPKGFGPQAGEVGPFGPFPRLTLPSPPPGVERVIWKRREHAIAPQASGGNCGP